MWTLPISRDRRATNSTSATSSIAGSVLGSATMVVTPPAAAAALPVSMVSSCSRPGSRSSTRMSTSPGARQWPRHSITAAPDASAPAPGPTAAIFPSATSRFPFWSSPLAGSRRRAFLNSVRAVIGSLHRRSVAELAGKHLETGHAHRHAHLHLLTDQAAVDVVRYLAVDLDAAVHGPRMHDERVGLGGRELARVEAEEVEVLADRGHEAAVHALGLQAQHHDDVGVLEALGHVVKDLDAHTVDLGGKQRARRHHAHSRAHGVEQVDVGARDPAVQDVAADRNHQALEPAPAAPDGERVEQRLGRVLVAAVAGVDDCAVDLLGEQMHRA